MNHPCGVRPRRPWIKGTKVMHDTLSTVYEITKLIKKSPKRDAIFNKLKDEISEGSPGIRILCPTRWTVRSEALTSISENYHVLQLTWDAAMEVTKTLKQELGLEELQHRWRSLNFSLELNLDAKSLI